MSACIVYIKVVAAGSLNLNTANLCQKASRMDGHQGYWTIVDFNPLDLDGIYRFIRRMTGNEFLCDVLLNSEALGPSLPYMPSLTVAFHNFNVIIRCSIETRSSLFIFVKTI